MVHTAEGVARRFVMKDVRVVEAALDPSGLRVLRVAVGDESHDGSPANPTMHPSPVFSPGLAAWARRLGTPAALPNVYLPAQRRLSEPHAPGIFAGARLDLTARNYLAGAPDAAALRMRARLLQWLACRSALDTREVQRWASITCGPAYPLAGAIMHAQRGGARVTATFIDTCTDALEVSRRIAVAHGLDPADHTYVAAAPDGGGWEGVLAPASQHVVEALGLIEMTRAEALPAVLAAAFRAVRPGGVLVLAVPLVGEARCECCASLGWPHGPGLDLGGIAEVLISAGIGVADAAVFVPDGGAHAVIEVCRP